MRTNYREPVYYFIQELFYYLCVCVWSVCKKERENAYMYVFMYMSKGLQTPTENKGYWNAPELVSQVFMSN